MEEDCDGGGWRRMKNNRVVMEEDFLGRFSGCSRGVDCSLRLGLPGNTPSTMSLSSSSQPQLMSSAPRFDVTEFCTMCATTQTPLWRSGPYGPKSLCNACGIRYKKEERRLTLSLEIPSTTITTSSSSSSTQRKINQSF